MESLLDGGAPVLEQVLVPCPSLVHHAQRLRSFVPGEFEDEDGDTATQFILADPLPGSSSASSSFQPVAPVARVASQDWEDADIVYLSDDDDDSGASFFCDLCRRNMPLQSVFSSLTCSCLFCRPCLRAHGEAVLVKKATQIGASADLSDDCYPMDEVAGTSGKRSSEEEKMITIIVDDSSREPLESIPCPKAECFGRFPLSSAQELAPEAFRS